MVIGTGGSGLSGEQAVGSCDAVSVAAVKGEFADGVGCNWRGRTVDGAVGGTYVRRELLGVDGRAVVFMGARGAAGKRVRVVEGEGVEGPGGVMLPRTREGAMTGRGMVLCLII